MFYWRQLEGVVLLGQNRSASPREVIACSLLPSYFTLWNVGQSPILNWYIIDVDMTAEAHASQTLNPPIMSDFNNIYSKFGSDTLQSRSRSQILMWRHNSCEHDSYNLCNHFHNYIEHTKPLKLIGNWALWPWRKGQGHPSQKLSEPSMV